MVLLLVKNNKKVSKKSREGSNLSSLKKEYWVLILQYKSQSIKIEKKPYIRITWENLIEFQV